MEKPFVLAPGWKLSIFEVKQSKTTRNVGSNCIAYTIPGFYEFYQIDTANESDDDDAEESGSEGKRESRGRTIGLHSPWGMIWNICETTGWTWNYVMDGVSWINIRMMIADSRRYVSGMKKMTEDEFLDDFCKD